MTKQKAQKLAKAHELRKSYENDQEKVDKIDKYINSSQSNNDNLREINSNHICCLQALIDE